MKRISIEIDLFDFIIIVLTKESPYDEMTVAYKTGIGPYKVSSLVILSSEIDLYIDFSINRWFILYLCYLLLFKGSLNVM